MAKCNMCPRECNANRDQGEIGLCHSPSDFSVAKVMLHKWEEPCLVGEHGAGTVFSEDATLDVSSARTKA